MSSMKKNRRLAGLTLQTLSRLTKIDAAKLSRAENSLVRLRPDERAAVRRALARGIRMRITQAQKFLGNHSFASDSSANQEVAANAH
jgi:hypothetical protein